MAFVRLGDIAGYSAERIEAQQIDKSNYVGVDNLLSNRRGKTDSMCVPTSGNYTRYNTGDTLIGNIRPYLKKIWLAKCTGGASGDVLVIRGDDNLITKKYLYYVLAADAFFAFDMQYSKGAKMPRGNKAEILKYVFPIPPLDEQEKVVLILDSFEQLCNDLTTGLPAEIDARQKQYEYYRDKMLKFRSTDDN